MERLTIETIRPKMASEMKFLLADYPREAWPDHPHFAQSIQNWLGAHQGFEALARHCRKKCEAWFDKRIDEENLSDHISHFGTMLVQSLHGHHHWEDHKYFPEIIGADARAARGIDLLESDHALLDPLLDDLARAGSRAIQLASLSPQDMAGEVKALHGYLETAEALLARHLRDEEEVIVPVLLHHKMRG